jgi:peptidoglycan hydrolase-like protein with peptidoglycan-binding domain
LRFIQDKKYYPFGYLPNSLITANLLDISLIKIKYQGNLIIMATPIKYPYNRPNLKLGDDIPVVKDMQKALNQRLAELDILSDKPLEVAITGYFGEQTRNAVKYFQCLAFLPIDGVVGDQTWRYLFEGSTCMPQLRQATSGSLVKAVQKTLQDAEFYLGTVDGIFGAKTAEAIAAFQASRHLKVDGIIGAVTWTALSQLDVQISRCTIEVFGD